MQSSADHILTVSETPPTLPATDPADAWAEAEEAAIRVLCEASGHTYGASAFLGDSGRYLNAFCLYNDATMNGGEVFHASRLSTFVLPYTAMGIFESRRAAQRWAMLIALALPVRAVGNLDQLRLSSNGIGALVQDSVQIAGESSPRPVFRLPLNLDLVVRVR